MFINNLDPIHNRHGEEKTDKDRSRGRRGGEGGQRRRRSKMHERTKKSLHRSDLLLLLLLILIPNDTSKRSTDCNPLYVT